MGEVSCVGKFAMPCIGGSWCSWEEGCIVPFLEMILKQEHVKMNRLLKKATAHICTKHAKASSGSVARKAREV